MEKIIVSRLSEYIRFVSSQELKKTLLKSLSAWIYFAVVVWAEDKRKSFLANFVKTFTNPWI